MQQLQYDSYYKFLVSVGITLIMASIALMVFLVSGNNDIIITQEQIATMCTESIELAYKRLTLLNFIYKWAPLLCLLLVGIGILLIAFGCWKWRVNQKMLDKRVELEVDEIRARLNQMSPSEVTIKASSEVEEAVSDNRKLNVNEKTIEKGRTYVEQVLKYQEIEEKCFISISKEKGDLYLIQQNVSFGREKIDIAAISKINNTDYLYEVKYRVDVPSQGFINSTVGKLIMKKKSYEDYMGRKAMPVLMIVTSTEIKELVKKTVNELNQKDLVEIRVMDERELF